MKAKPTNADPFEESRRFFAAVEARAARHVKAGMRNVEAAELAIEEELALDRTEREPEPTGEELPAAISAIA
jgi:hypothetical protein